MIDHEESEVLENHDHEPALLSTIAELAKLDDVRDGWMDGAGAGVVSRDKTWVHGAVLGIVARTNLGTPGLFPTPEGNIQAEWVDEDQQLDVTVVFDLDRRRVRLELLHLNAGMAEDNLEFEPQQLDALLSAIEAARGGGAA